MKLLKCVACGNYFDYKETKENYNDYYENKLSYDEMYGKEDPHCYDCAIYDTNDGLSGWASIPNAEDLLE